MFIIYVNELPEIVNYATNIFADDTSIYAIGETLSEITSTLQSAVTALSQWFSEWALEVNASKTKVMFKLKCDTHIIMNQREPEVVKSHKHL